MNDYADKKSLIIYVTVGFPKSAVPLQNKVSMIVWLGEKTIIQSAKELRKTIADAQVVYDKDGGKHHMNPSHLYYAVFTQRTDIEPAVVSDNFPGVYDQKKNPQGIIVNL